MTAMVLPALFAACANEELEVIGNNADNSRAVVENVVLDFSNGVESRLAYGAEGYAWEANDQIGACLMDQISSNYRDYTKSWSSWFDLVNYIQTNYKFTRDAEGNWETEAKLCEGNYFFAYPYNANMGLRQAYSFSVADQVLAGTSTADLQKSFTDNNGFLGYGKVAANSNEGESVSVPMIPVFGATGFTLINTGTNTYKVEKVVLNGKAVSSYAVVTPKDKFTVAHANGEPGTPSDYTVAGDLADVLTYTWNGRIDATIESGNSIAPQGSMRLIVMSAEAAVNITNTAVLEIHTDKGLIRGINLDAKHEALNGSLDGDDAVVNVLTDKALPKLGTGDKIEVTFDDTSLDKPAIMDIYSSDELARFIKWNKAVNKVDLTANLKGNVTITKEMCEDLAASTIMSITLKGAYTVAIAADAAENAMDLFTFGENINEVIVLGTQTITKSPKTIAKVSVKAGATLNVSKDIVGVVVNEGTVNVKANISLGTLKNAGTLVADGNLSNTTLYNIGTVTNNKVMTVTGKNNGTITNNGTLKGGLENAAKFACTTHGVNHAAGVINNYGKVTGILNNALVNIKVATAEYNNSDADSEGKIENTIMSKYVNKANGEQIIAVIGGETNASQVVAIVKGSGASELYLSGTIVLDPETDKDGNLKEINVIGQEKDLTVYTQGLTITGEGTINFFENKVTTSWADFMVAQNTTIVETDVVLNVGKLTVETNPDYSALLKIQKGAAVYCSEYANANIDNYGTLAVRETASDNNQQGGTTNPGGNPGTTYPGGNWWENMWGN